MSETGSFDSPEVEQSMSQQVADILRGLGEELGFDNETIAEIESMDFESAFETAYGYLTQAGLDADEVLADLVEDTVVGIEEQ